MKMRRPLGIVLSVSPDNLPRLVVVVIDDASGVSITVERGELSRIPGIAFEKPG